MFSREITFGIKGNAQLDRNRRISAANTFESTGRAASAIHAHPRSAAAKLNLITVYDMEQIKGVITRGSKVSSLVST